MAFQLQAAFNSLKSVANVANASANAAADVMARKATEMTGRQINGPQLKSAAIKIGGIAMGFGAVMAVANIASSTVGPTVAGGGTGGGDDPQPDPGVSHDANGYPDTGDFEGNVGMCFAQNGIAVHEMTPCVTSEGDVSWES